MCVGRCALGGCLSFQAEVIASRAKRSRRGASGPVDQCVRAQAMLYSRGTLAAARVCLVQAQVGDLCPGKMPQSPQELRGWEASHGLRGHSFTDTVPKGSLLWLLSFLPRPQFRAGTSICSMLGLSHSCVLPWELPSAEVNCVAQG